MKKDDLYHALISPVLGMELILEAALADAGPHEELSLKIREALAGVRQLKRVVEAQREEQYE